MREKWYVILLFFVLTGVNTYSYSVETSNEILNCISNRIYEDCRNDTIYYDCDIDFKLDSLKNVWCKHILENQNPDGIKQVLISFEENCNLKNMGLYLDSVNHLIIVCGQNYLKYMDGYSWNGETIDCVKTALRFELSLSLISFSPLSINIFSLALYCITIVLPIIYRKKIIIRLKKIIKIDSHINIKKD